MKHAIRAAALSIALVISGTALCAAEPKKKEEKPPTRTNVKVGGLKEIKAFLAENHGKVVVIDFWATWCEPCKEMFPHLVMLHNKHWAEGLRVATVSIDEVEKIEDVKEFVNKHRAFFPVITLDLGKDNWDTVATAINKELFPSVKYDGGVPVTLVFGRDGKLIKAYMEKAPESDLANHIEKALGAK